MKFLAFLLSLLILAPLANAQLPGHSGRATFIYNNGTINATSSFTLSLEATAQLGFKIAKVCWTIPPATAAAAATLYMIRTNTASSGGNTVVNNNTSAAGFGSMMALDPVDGNWPGVARWNAGVVGTSAGIMDQWSVVVPTIASGVPGIQGCKDWGTNGEKMPTVPPGVANGIQFTFPPAGAGALAASSLYIEIIRE